MAKNYIQPGRTVSITAPAAVSSGDGVLVGSLFGIATGDAGSGDPLEIALQGVFTLPKVSTDAMAAGDLLYWDDVQKLLTVTATANKLVGVALSDAGNPSSEVAIRLNGAFSQ